MTLPALRFTLLTLSHLFRPTHWMNVESGIFLCEVRLSGEIIAQDGYSLSLFRIIKPLLGPLLLFVLLPESPFLCLDQNSLVGDGTHGRNHLLVGIYGGELGGGAIAVCASLKTHCF